MTRESIERELLSWMREDDWTANHEKFERLALDLFAFQYQHCRPYALLCDALGRTPENVDRANSIPAVPTGAFKEFALRCFEPEETIRTFRTSGTATQRRGELHLDRLDLYETSLLASLRHALLSVARENADHRHATGDPSPSISRMRFLASSADEAPDSSLSYMFSALKEAEADDESGFDLRAGELDLDSFRNAVREAQRDEEAILVAGTAFAFVHFLDATDDTDAASTNWRLPRGSRLMETGGFKGRSREVAREALHAALADRFMIPIESVINQYGMTELGSQFYDSTWLDPTGPRRKLVPPWTRVRFVDPTTALDVEAGEVGMILIHDLANTGSVAAIQTADLGQAVLDAKDRVIGFEVIGRAEGAEARGCSIATDIMLEASSGLREASISPAPEGESTA